MDKMDKADRMRIPRTVAATAGTAVMALLMVGVVTFGATAIRPLTAGNEADQQTARTDRGTDGSGSLGHGGDAGTAGKDRTDTAFDDHKVVDVMDGDGKGEHPYLPKQPKEEPQEEPIQEPKPTQAPVEQPKDEPQPTAKPTAKPEPKPTTKPATTTLALEAWVKSGKAKLSWSKFSGEGFAYYKVVRSADESVTWPLGGNDTLVAAVGDRFSPYAVDQPSCGAKVFYAVFAVKHTDAGYAVLAASNVAKLFVECAPETPAEPKLMSFELALVDGGVKLAWEKCTSDGFVYYKVVRSATNESPTYPLHDGDQLLAAIGDPHQTMFVDGDVEPGQTWTYRVLSFGEGPDGKVLLGATNPRTITVE